MTTTFKNPKYIVPTDTTTVDLIYTHPKYGDMAYTYKVGMSDCPAGLVEYLRAAEIAPYEAPDLSRVDILANLNGAYELEVTDNSNTVDVHGTKFQAGDRTKDFLTKLITLYNVSGSVGPNNTFTDFYNVRQPFTGIWYLVAIANAIAERDLLLYTKLQDLKDIVRNPATTQAELSAVAWANT